MIAALRIRGLGPHKDTTIALDAYGVTTISGRSEVGKSTLLDAICFALWGTNRHGKAFDLRAIHDGQREVRVDLTTGRGATLSRSLPVDEAGKRGEPVRTLTRKDGTSRTYATEALWRTALDWLGQVDALRIALVPRAWEALETGEHGGKAFRDLLSSITGSEAGKQAIITELMLEKGHAFRRGDPLNEKDAAELARQEGIKVQRAGATVETLQAELQTAEATPTQEVASDPQALRHAREVLRVAKLWADGDRAREQHAAAVHRRATAEADLTRWTCAIADLGPEPAKTRKRAEVEADIARHSGAKARAEAVLPESHRMSTPQIVQPAGHLVAAVNKAARLASDAIAAAETTTDVCTCCGRPGWLGAKHAANALAEKLTAEKLAADKAVEDDVAYRREVEAKRAEGAAANAATKQAEIEAADKALTQLRAELAAIIEADGWHARRRVIGARPEPVDVGDLPADPAQDRPHSDEIDDAREVLDAHERATGATAERESTIRGITQRFDEAREALDQHAFEHERLKALLDAIRLEPSVAVRRQLGALGDLGPVTIELPGKGAQVLIDGRPWWMASTGRQVVADVWLRAGIRRALGEKAKVWPLVIDCAQDVGGQELPTPEPAIVLETTDENALRVAAAERAA